MILWSQITSPVSSSSALGLGSSVPEPAKEVDEMAGGCFIFRCHRVMIVLLVIKAAHQKEPALERCCPCNAESARELWSKGPARRSPITRLCLVKDLCSVQGSIGWSICTGSSSNNKNLNKNGDQGIDYGITDLPSTPSILPHACFWRLVLKDGKDSTNPSASYLRSGIHQESLQHLSSDQRQATVETLLK